MRLLFTLVALVVIAVTLAMAPSHAQQGGATLPIPQPVPTLPGQSLNACLITCNTQVGTCQGSCQSLSSGLVGAVNTVVGTTTNATQCYLNCTAQQTICASNCSATTSTSIIGR